MSTVLSGLGYLNRRIRPVSPESFLCESCRLNRRSPCLWSTRALLLGCGYRLDFIVAGKVIIELKAVEAFQPVHEAQLLTYLRLAGCRVGLLVNFNVPVLKRGIKRMVL